MTLEATSAFQHSGEYFPTEGVANSLHRVSVSRQTPVQIGGHNLCSTRKELITMNDRRIYAYP